MFLWMTRADATIPRVASPLPGISYTREEACRLLTISERQLRQWERQELIPPAAAYGFSELIALRSLIRLRDSKIPTAQIRAALQALRVKLSHVRDPLRELKVISEGGRMRVLVDGQAMDALSGQLLLDFDATELKKLLSFPGTERAPNVRDKQRQKLDADQWFQRGVEREQAKAPLAEVVEAYTKASELDPTNAAPLVNLGTAYFNARRWREAESSYRKALIVHPDYALAHFNLANLHDERGDRARALQHYSEALRVQPQYADAHYNVALLYQGQGEWLKAVRHWQAFLKLDASSNWAEIARRELDKLRRHTVVDGTRRKRAE